MRLDMAERIRLPRRGAPARGSAPLAAAQAEAASLEARLRLCPLTFQ